MRLLKPRLEILGRVQVETKRPGRPTLHKVSLFGFCVALAVLCRTRECLILKATWNDKMLLGDEVTVGINPRSQRAQTKAGTYQMSVSDVGPVAAGYGLSHEDAPWAQAVTLAGDLRAAWRAAGR
jgi:hypothetical protein